MPRHVNVPQWVMPSLKDLLDAKQAAVVVLDEKQRGYQLALDDLNVARRKVETAWRAAAGGVALAHANEDSGFRAAFTAILDERLRTRRDRKLLEEWKAGPPPAPDQAPDTTPTNTAKARRARRRDLDLDLETVSGAELLENLKQLETNAQLLEKEVADAKAGADQAGAALRRRDDHWRIKVGETVLAHAADNDEFRQSLDRIFERRIAEHHRALLDRWRNRTAVGTTPPPAASAYRGWKPQRLPDRSWGAVFPDPAGKTLPDPLVGATIVVRTGGGDQWSTKIKEVIEQNDTGVLVRTEGRQDTAPAAGATRSAPRPAANQSAAKVPEKSSEAIEQNDTSVLVRTEGRQDTAPAAGTTRSTPGPAANQSTAKVPEKSDAAVKKPVG